MGRSVVACGQIIVHVKTMTRACPAYECVAVTPLGASSATKATPLHSWLLGDETRNELKQVSSIEPPGLHPHWQDAAVSPQF